MGNEDFVGVGLVGVLFGALGVIGVRGCLGPAVEEVKVFKEGNKPTVARVYARSCRDQIILENADKPGVYDMQLYNYLSTIENKADRELEEARIKKQVRWYEE